MHLEPSPSAVLEKAGLGLYDGSRIYRGSDKADARKALKVSLYKGQHSPDKDYDQIEPAVTESFNLLGGCKEARIDWFLSLPEADRQVHYEAIGSRI